MIVNKKCETAEKALLFISGPRCDDETTSRAREPAETETVATTPAPAVNTPTQHFRLTASRITIEETARVTDFGPAKLMIES